MRHGFSHISCAIGYLLPTHPLPHPHPIVYPSLPPFNTVQLHTAQAHTYKRLHMRLAAMRPPTSLLRAGPPAPPHQPPALMPPQLARGLRSLPAAGPGRQQPLTVARATATRPPRLEDLTKSMSVQSTELAELAFRDARVSCQGAYWLPVGPRGQRDLDARGPSRGTAAAWAETYGSCPSPPSCKATTPAGECSCVAACACG